MIAGGGLLKLGGSAFPLAEEGESEPKIVLGHRPKERHVECSCKASRKTLAASLSSPVPGCRSPIR